MASPTLRLAPKRACDACRRRKVKCDASAPKCANCCISLLPCLYTEVPRKRGPKTSRLHRSIPGHDHDGQSFPSINDLLSPSSSSPAETTVHEDQSQSWLAVVASSPFLTADATQTAQKAGRIRDDLMAALARDLPSTAVQAVADTCISLFMQYFFPQSPICHEPTLRTSVLVFFAPDASSEIAFLVDNDEGAPIIAMKNFALVTAVCAATSYVIPDALLPCRHSIGAPFLRASRDMLRLYEDHDFEHPSSYSLNIRLMQSSALQHATGRTEVAWHVLGQARLLAQDLRLHDEQSLERFDPLEAKLLRLCFWVLYTADKTAAALACRPVTLHELLFDSRLSLNRHSNESVSLLDLQRRHLQPCFESHLVAGFHLSRQIWSMTSDLVLNIRWSDGRWSEFIRGLGEPPASIARLTQQYLEFSALLDDVPPWLDNPNQVNSADEEAVNYQTTSYWVLKANVLTSFHCAKMVILRTAIQYNMTAIMGLSPQPLTLAMKKADISHDLLQDLLSMPFKFLQVSGEPFVEKIRVVGSTLLELVEDVDNETIKARARSSLARLLDILARLDSRASDELIQRYS